MAFCPRTDDDPVDEPRVLLIDEIDKADIDLPNDLLDILERGEFRIGELMRYGDEQSDQVGFDVFGPADGSPIRVPSTVQCARFPLIFMTSNGERDFGPAFNRRCLRLRLEPPETPSPLRDVVKAHFGEEHYEKNRQGVEKLVSQFLANADSGTLAMDQLLNAVHLVAGGLELDDEERALLTDLVLAALDEPAD